MFDLSGANLSDTFLVGTNLENANLSDANLSKALLEAGSRRVKVRVRINLRRADLSGAVLESANLKGAKFVIEQLDQAKSLEGATMPDGQILKSDDNPDGPTFEEWRKSRGEENGGSQ